MRSVTHKLYAGIGAVREGTRIKKSALCDGGRRQGGPGSDMAGSSRARKQSLRLGELGRVGLAAVSGLLVLCLLGSE